MAAKNGSLRIVCFGPDHKWRIWRTKAVVKWKTGKGKGKGDEKVHVRETIAVRCHPLRPGDAAVLLAEPTDCDKVKTIGASPRP